VRIAAPDSTDSTIDAMLLHWMAYRRRWFWRSRTRVGAVGGLILTACHASDGPVDAAEAEGSGGEGHDVGMATGGSSDGSSDASTAAGSENTADAGETGDTSTPSECVPAASAPIRRLSHQEYRNTVADLLPGLALPELTLVSDPSVRGFSNNAEALAPSELLVSQYYRAARSIAEVVVEDVTALVPCDPAASDCAAQFITEFGLRAFRRPLTEDEVERYTGLFAVSESFEIGVAATVQAMLQAPQFLYRPEVGVEEAATGYEVASRLSYFLWATMPDEPLFEAAQNGGLEQRSGVETQVVRMLADDRARAGFVHFHREWLDFDRIMTVQKLPEDGFDDPVREAVMRSAESFVERQYSDPEATFADLLTSNVFAVDARLADVLGVEPPEDGAWAEVEVDPSQRSGILTHPAILAALAYAEYPSPVLRGEFVLDQLLCAAPGPPPPGTDTTLPDRTESEPRTNREIYEAATTGKGGACASCHLPINAIGYSFEHYDRIGRYRTLDREIEVDASGSFAGQDFTNAVELSAQLANSELFTSCVVEHWVAYATGGDEVLAEGCLTEQLTERVLAEGLGPVELLAEIAMHPVFTGVGDE